MKIIESIYDYELEARNQIAHFKNRLIKAFWEKRMPNSPSDYYETNKAFGAIIEDMILTCEVSYTVDFETIKRAPEGYIEQEVIHRLSSLIAQEIMKSDIAYIIKRNEMFGGNKFVVTIPFIKTEPSK